MKIKEIMTRDVEGVGPDATVGDAAQIMKDLNIGFLVVGHKNRLVGVMTDRDIATRCVAAGKDPEFTHCREIMTPGAFSCYEDSDVEEVAAEMRGREVHRMVIVDKNQRVCGVVSLGDIARAKGEQTLAGEILKDLSKAA